MADKTRQVATRVSPETWRTLQVALVVEGAATMQDLLKPVVEEYAERLAAEPEITKILEQAEKYRERTTGVRKLRQQQGGRRKKASGGRS